MNQAIRLVQRGLRRQMCKPTSATLILRWCCVRRFLRPQGAQYVMEQAITPTARSEEADVHLQRQQHLIHLMGFSWRCSQTICSHKAGSTSCDMQTGLCRCFQEQALRRELSLSSIEHPVELFIEHAHACPASRVQELEGTCCEDAMIRSRRSSAGPFAPKGQSERFADVSLS